MMTLIQFAFCSHIVYLQACTAYREHYIHGLNCISDLLNTGLHVQIALPWQLKGNIASHGMKPAAVNFVELNPATRGCASQGLLIY